MTKNKSASHFNKYLLTPLFTVERSCEEFRGVTLNRGCRNHASAPVGLWAYGL